MELKLTIGDPKSGKTVTKTIAEDDAKVLHGKRLGETIKGELVGLEGYELFISGGSDYCGFPMRRDVDGTMRRRILIVGGVGLRTNKRDGRRVRRSVAGNTVYARTAQLNVKVTKHGKGPLVEAAPAEGDAPAAEDAA